MLSENTERRNTSENRICMMAFVRFIWLCANRHSHCQTLHLYHLLIIPNLKILKSITRFEYLSTFHLILKILSKNRMEKLLVLPYTFILFE